MALVAIVAGILPLAVSIKSCSGHMRQGPRRHALPGLLPANTQTGGSATSGSVFSGEKVRDYKTAALPLAGRSSSSGIACTLPKVKGTQCTSWAVMTTINNVTESVAHTCDHLRDWCIAVVADRKTPREYTYDGACHMIYIDVNMQKDWSRTCGFVGDLPWNHFSRKNIGYLFAIVNGAQRVWDFDDDNELTGPHPVTLGAGNSVVDAWSLPKHRSDVINPYPLLGASAFSWPRGFPLSRIKDNATTPSRADVLEGQWDARRIAIVQALAQGDPDVDAVYRLTRPIPFSFEHDVGTLLEVPRGTLVPLNAQATLLRFRSVLWSLLLPRTVHGRVSDIWRAYIMQRLMADYGMGIAFSGAWVVQHRNPHSYIADFDSELPLYLQTDALVRVLTEWRNTGQSLPESAVQLYVELYERGFLEIDDVSMMQVWLEALSSSGYEFPARSLS